MLDNSTDYGNDVMVTQLAFLLLKRAIFRETSTEMDVKTVNVVVKKKSTIILWRLISFDHSDVISKVDKSTENFCRFVKSTSELSLPPSHPRPQD